MAPNSHLLKFSIGEIHKFGVVYANTRTVVNPIVSCTSWGTLALETHIHIVNPLSQKSKSFGSTHVTVLEFHFGWTNSSNCTNSWQYSLQLLRILQFNY